MVYELNVDVELYENAEEKNENIILVYETNINEIEYDGFKKQSFHTCILKNMFFEEWPIVEFYYDSQKGNNGLHYLWNINDWPVIHKDVMNRFIQMEIKGVEYYPIRLVDKKTGSINNDYVLMYIRNFIDAYDMEKSKYNYIEKLNVYIFEPHGIVMNQEECSKYDIFRCNQFVSIIYISERIRDEIVQNDWIGMRTYETRGGRYCG